MNMDMPLSGVRVLDFTVWQAGPMASVLLGSLGAEVIKIELSGGDPSRYTKQVRGIPVIFPGGLSLHHQVYNRNKKGIALNLKHPLGREVVYRLVSKSDVFVSSYVHRVDEKLGVDYKTLSRYNPRLIYAKISSFGHHGPEADKSAMDLAGAARSGLAMICGEADSPPDSIRGGIADEATAVFTTLGVLAALLARERTGVGQEVNTSMLGSMIHLLEITVAITLNFGKELPREGHYQARNPLWNYYQCKDGKWIILSHFEPEKFWSSFCKVTGIQHLEHDPRFSSIEVRSQNYSELIEILDEIFLTKTRDEWLRLFESENLIATVVNTVGDLAHDPQVIANNYLAELDHSVAGKIRVTGPAIQFSKTPMNTVRFQAPELGEHTEEILKDVGGYSNSEITKLRSEGVVK